MGNTESGNTSESNSGKKPAFHISKEPLAQSKLGEDVHKYEATLGEPPENSSEPPAYEELGSLPINYGSKSLYLVARDPHWLFSYWDIDWEAYPVVRMQDGKVILKVYNADGAEIYTADVNADARNWYVPVTDGNATFYAEIGFVNEDALWEVIARSNDAATPSSGISNEVSDSFATVPYHLAFQNMLDVVKASMGDGESLLSTLSRIQNTGRQLAFVLGTTPHWTDSQRRILASLLGNELNQIMGLGSAEIDLILRKQLTDRLSSETSSGLSAGGGATVDSSLFSGFAAFGSWTELSSWTAGAESSSLMSWSGGENDTAALSSWLASWGGPVESEFWSSWLTSWTGGVGKGSAALSSWLASWSAAVGSGDTAALSSWLTSWSGVGGKESTALSSWLSSWAGGVGNESISLSSWLSSWSGAGGVESAALSSWLSSWSGGGENTFWSSYLSSWPSAMGASESAFWSSWLSSWSGGAEGGSSGAFGSSEFASSWSSYPTSEAREFSLNAEVIFYGAASSASKIWIDGKPVELTAEGAYRFHLKFPDGDYSVPIITESADGSERRSGFLRLERGAVI